MLQPFSVGWGYWGVNILAGLLLAYQLYMPIWILDRKGWQLEHLFLLSTPITGSAFWADIGRSIGLMLACFPIFFAGYSFILSNFLDIHNKFQWALPNPTIFIVTQIFLVALPEEFFYRGFVQGLLRKNYRIIPAILITSGIFAISHLLASHNLQDLFTFFPGMLFSWLVYRSGSIVGATLFHAACNILGALLYWGFLG